MYKVILNSDFIVIKVGDVIVYNYDGEIWEYIFILNEYFVVGVGILVCFCLDVSGIYKVGYVICCFVDFNLWEYVLDYCGEMVYSIKIGELKEIKVLGDYFENIIIIVFLFLYDKWDGEKWVIDIEVQYSVVVDVVEVQCQLLIDVVMVFISLI